VTFATKPQLAQRMIERAVTAKVPFAWVAGDEVYGDNGPLRTWLEENFQAGKGLTGLDEHQVRRWTSWHRWVTLAMAAAAVLTIAAALEHARSPDPDGLIPLTRNEIAHLLATTIVRPAHDTSHRMRWSGWRRRHQYRSRTCHCQRQTAYDQGK
jgi:hypothetical protein